MVWTVWMVSKMAIMLIMQIKLNMQRREPGRDLISFLYNYLHDHDHDPGVDGVNCELSDHGEDGVGAEGDGDHVDHAH